MAKSFSTRLEHAWNAFRGLSDEAPEMPVGAEVAYGFRPERIRMSGHSGRRIIAPIVTQIAVDAAGLRCDM